MNILIVEDQEESRYLLESLLKGNGHKVHWATNGADALKMLKTGAIDLVVSDILMPVMDGFQFCREVKRDEALRAIPIIIYTATYTGPQDEAMALRMGADRFIVKPCEPDLFLKHIDEVMGAAGRRKNEALPGPPDKEEVFKLYNERLVRKLEQKMLEAERELVARQAAERALLESRERLIMAQRIAKMGDFTWDIASGAVTWSDAMFELLGYEKNAAIDYDLINRQVHYPEDLPSVKAWLEECIESGRANHGPKEYRLVRKDGKILFIQALIAVRHRNGSPHEVFGTIQDISDRKQAERSLQESEHKFRMIIENSRDIIFTLSAQGRFLFVSPAIRFLLGYDEDELIGRRFHAIIHPDDVAGYEQAMDRIIHNGSTTAHFEYRARHSNGEWRLHTASGGAVHDADGNLIHFQGVARDITERRKLEEQLRQAQKMESVGRLAGGVAHDYNNMLSVILGYTEMALAKATANDPLHSDLREILHAARRSADITGQLLAFARRQTIAPEVLDLNASVESLLKMLRRLIGENITLAWLPGTGLWPVRMDPSQLNQILANLCVNARDAISGIGKISIETANVHLDEVVSAEHVCFASGDYALLMVSDDGPGMGKEVLEHLFEPFFTTKEVGKGTGLGLATVYGIVQQNAGIINVYSEPGKGTTFKIYLPRHAGQAAACASPAAEEIAKSRGETVLVVEDEEAILMLCEKVLENMEYRVLTAGTPREAIEMAGRNEGPIHLLISDVVLPEMNGRELSETLRAMHPGLKSLFMSGYTADLIAHHGALDQGVHFLQKPFSTKDLTRKVRQVLDHG